MADSKQAKVSTATNAARKEMVRRVHLSSAGRGRKSVQIRKSARKKSKGIACSGPAIVDLELTSGDAIVCDASTAVKSGRR